MLGYGAEGFVIVSRHARIVNHNAIMQFCPDSAFDYIPVSVFFHACAVAIAKQFDLHVAPISEKPETVRRGITFDQANKSTVQR
jgi:hypothetical protein